MQTSSSSFFCNSNTLCSPTATIFSFFRQFSLPFRYRIYKPAEVQVRLQALNCRRTRKLPISSIAGTATEEIVETTASGSEYIEIGYICDVHGLQGEVSVKCNTDFPELRFSKGKRWLRQRFSGKEEVQEVDLIEGRGHPGHKRWIVKFRGIDCVDQAMQLVGANLLVRETDRPQLDDGEFYSRDLVGMKVIMKETGQPVGTVVNIFNYGASDLLHVRLDSSLELPNGRIRQNSLGPLVYVPFVGAIVPKVDMNRREMHITPPKGLLQLNIQSDEKSKKERRLSEWKERKKFQRRLIAAKKKLCEMEQHHVFHGFRFGKKSQASFLGDQIVSVNSKLLQQALQSIDRCSSMDFTNTLSYWPRARSLNISEECLMNASRRELDEYSDLLDSGLDLIAQGKLATVLVLKDENQGAIAYPDPVHFESAVFSSISHVHTLLESNGRFAKVQHRALLPLIMISPASTILHLEKLFTTYEYFGFDSEKVWFLEEEQLPVVSNSLKEHERKILMKSPWEILQSPIGSGGILIALSSNNILEDLIRMGVEYIELCSISSRCLAGNPIFLSFTNSCKAHVGFRTFQNFTNLEDDFHMVLSTKFVKYVINQINTPRFQAIPKANPYVEKVDKEWVDVLPSSANSYEFRCSIYEVLNACSPDQVCLMEVKG